jgi:hypothetical protein
MESQSINSKKKFSKGNSKWKKMLFYGSTSFNWIDNKQNNGNQPS